MGMLFFGVQARWWGVGIWTFVLIPTVIMAMVARKSKRVLVQTLDAKGLKVSWRASGRGSCGGAGTFILRPNPSLVRRSTPSTSGWPASQRCPR
jgi:hypothetical protein